MGVILNKAGADDLDAGSYYRYEATGETAERLEADRPTRPWPEEPTAPRERPKATPPPARTPAPPVEQV